MILILESVLISAEAAMGPAAKAAATATAIVCFLIPIFLIGASLLAFCLLEATVVQQSRTILITSPCRIATAALARCALLRNASRSGLLRCGYTAHVIERLSASTHGAPHRSVIAAWQRARPSLTRAADPSIRSHQIWRSRHNLRPCFVRVRRSIP